MSDVCVADRRPACRLRTPSTRLRVIATHCPQAMWHILDILARQAMTRWVIAYSRCPRTQFFEAQTGDLTVTASDTLAITFEPLAQVRSVWISRRDAGAAR